MGSRVERERAARHSTLAARLVLAALLGAGGCSLLGSSPKPTAPRAAEEDLKGPVLWPAEGRVSSLFGPRGHTHHDGIDIAAPEGTPVYVVADGTVIFSGALRGYGNTVIVEHRSGLTTVYAHNRENLVQNGVHVHRGETIANIGQTGKTTGPNLHFEVRRNKVARDPLAFLPKRAPSMVAQQKPAPRRVGVGG